MSAASLLKKRQSLTRQNSISSQTCPFSSSPPCTQSLLGPKPMVSVVGKSSGNTITMSISNSLLKKRQSMTEQQSFSNTQTRGSTSFTCPVTGQSSLKPSNTNIGSQDGSSACILKKRQSFSDQISSTISSTSSVCPMTYSKAVTPVGSSKSKKENISCSNLLLKKRQSLEHNTIVATSSSSSTITAPLPKGCLSSGSGTMKSSPKENGSAANNQLTFSKLASSNGYFSQVLRVSWNIIEAEIMASETFQLGQDIEKFYELHQQLSMDDLARRRATHTRVCLVRVLGKVVKNLNNPIELETYLKCIGRLHQLAGVDQSYLTLSGQAFCAALDSIEHHKDLWSKQVKATWYLLFKLIVDKMTQGYSSTTDNKLILISFEHRALITEVWNVLQESTIRYVSNTMFLPLIVRSNKSLQKYFTSFDQALMGMEVIESYGTKFDKTKHGSLFLSKILTRVVPHMDQLDRVLPYLAELGALHQKHGVARQHIDLLGLAFCSAIRGVVQGGGVKGGHLHETTKAWISLVQAICMGMKMGYTREEGKQAQEEEEWLGDQEEEYDLRWRKSMRSSSSASCRLMEKRQAVSYEQQSSILEDELGRRRRKMRCSRINDFLCVKGRRNRN